MLESYIHDKMNPIERHVANCTKHAFIRCAHCGKLLCLEHFLDRVCFHEPSDRTDSPGSSSMSSGSVSLSDLMQDDGIVDARLLGIDDEPDEGDGLEDD